MRRNLALARLPTEQSLETIRPALWPNGVSGEGVVRRKEQLPLPTDHPAKEKKRATVMERPDQRFPLPCRGLCAPRL